MPPDIPEVPCGFCGQPTWPGLKWPSLDDLRVYLWCCDDCAYILEDTDDRVIKSTVLLRDGMTEN